MKYILSMFLLLLVSTSSVAATCNDLELTYGDDAQAICQSACGENTCYLNFNPGDSQANLYKDDSCTQVCSGTEE